MRILMLAPQVPYPPYKGTTARNLNLLKNLATRHEVSLLCFGSHADEPGVAMLRQICQDVHVVPAPVRSKTARLWSIASTSLPDLVLRLSSRGFADVLVRLLGQREFDLVQIEGLEMARHWQMAAESTAEVRNPLVVLDEHNAEYVLQQRACWTDSRRPSKWHGALYSFIQWQKLRRYEAGFCRKVDGVVAVSEADRRALQSIAGPLRTVVIPNGVDVEYFVPPKDLGPSRQQATMVFVGTMDFRPNVDAVVWFCDEILPRVQRSVADASLSIVGNNPKGEVRTLARRQGVVVTGFVEDVRPLVRAASAYVVPLRYGGGSRFKVVEAMAMGAPVVTTTLGCEGIAVAPGRDVLVADSPEEFAAATIRLLRDADLGKGMGERAREVAETLYDWRRIVPGLDDFYRQLTYGKLLT